MWIDPSNPTGGFALTASGHTYHTATPDVPADLFLTFYAIEHFPDRMPGDGIGFDFTYPIPEFTYPIPEPATVLLLGSGLIGLVGYGRKKFFKK